MLAKLLHPFGSKLVAGVALPFALNGTAVAAAPLIGVGDPAGVDLTSTHPNPRIGPNTIALPGAFDLTRRRAVTLLTVNSRRSVVFGPEYH